MFLNFLIFGSGHGMGAPFFDQQFYWLVNTENAGRSGKNGQFYTWIGGLGAQLQSIQFRRPLPGEIRTLAGKKFRSFNANRGYIRLFGFGIIPLKWQVSWALCEGLPENLDEAHKKIRELKEQIQRPY